MGRLTFVYRIIKLVRQTNTTTKVSLLVNVVTGKGFCKRSCFRVLRKPSFLLQALGPGTRHENMSDTVAGDEKKDKKNYIDTADGDETKTK